MSPIRVEETGDLSWKVERLYDAWSDSHRCHDRVAVLGCDSCMQSEGTSRCCCRKCLVQRSRIFGCWTWQRDHLPSVVEVSPHQTFEEPHASCEVSWRVFVGPRVLLEIQVLTLKGETRSGKSVEMRHVATGVIVKDVSVWQMLHGCWSSHTLEMKSS